MKEEIFLIESTLIVVFGKRFDFLNNVELKEQIIEKLSFAKEVIFDLEKTDYISSVFIQLSLVILKTIGKKNFKIINAKSPFVKRIIQLSNVGTVLNVYDSNPDQQINIIA